MQLVIGVFTIIYLLLAKPALAIKFSLIAPTGTLKRGDTARFTVQIDTQGETVYSTEIGANYQSQYIEFKQALPTDDFPTINVKRLSDSSLLISGSNPSGFNGQGIFTYLEFQIIADAPGSAQLCSLFAPTPTSGYPTTPPGNSPTPNPTSPYTQYPTITPLPTYIKSSPPPIQKGPPPPTGNFSTVIHLTAISLVLISFRFIYNKVKLKS